MDEGWTRWLLERYGFSFSNITNADFHAGALGDRFDVIVLPAESPRALLDGFTKGAVPPRYEGGLGATGVRALDAFVRNGGTLVCLNQSSNFAIEHLHLPVRNVVGERASMDEGWTRWLLERYGFSFSNITNADFHAGALGDRFDVIVLPAESPRALLDGFTKGAVPPRYEGGLGATGVRALDAFVRNGGTLVCLNQSSNFAIEHLHLPVRNVVGELDRKDFFASSSILEVATDPSHPVMAGMPAKAKVFVSRSPVFTTEEGFEGGALATYGKAGSPLLSGYLLGAEHIQGYAAALDVHHGTGHVLLIGFRPQWRGQSFGTFRVLFNAVLYGGALAAQNHGDPDFWSAPEGESEEGEGEKGGEEGGF